MNEYQKEQWDALTQIKSALHRLTSSDHAELDQAMAPYIRFRGKLDRFLGQHFAGHCSLTCFQSELSACCSKDGIITFWADVAINALRSSTEEIQILLDAIRNPRSPNKCIYLGPAGCCWHLRPLVCAMFLCDQVQDIVLASRPEIASRWQALENEAKGFRWPDRPVLFDLMEQKFIAAGCRSSLMFLNTSPGLLRIKQQAGLPPF